MSKKKSKLWAAIAAQQAAQAKQNQINQYNAAERAEGASKDNTYAANRQSVAQQNGTVEYKGFVKRHMDQLTSILGIRK